MSDANVILFPQTIRFTHIGRCCSCGVEMALLDTLEVNRRRDRETFYCPNGHPQHWKGKSDLERLREEVAAAKERAARAEQRAREEAEHAKRQVAVARGQVTKIKNRVGNGVCPCCNRSFQNLMRHMSTKHPGYAHDKEGTGQ